ncbi:MAG TPA: hypothetical protein V6D00_10220 [Pantanalinema sp.]
MRIGKIVSSRSHLDYVCQIYHPGEIPDVPSPASYAFGRFVRLSGDAVGIVYDSQLQNPDFGNFGPRLSNSPQEIRVFTPDLIDEQATLVSLLLLGRLSGAHGIHEVPGEVIPVHSEVETLPDEAFVAFHRDEAGRIQLRYLPLVQAHGGPASLSLLLAVLDRLNSLCPEDRARLGVLRNALNWQRTIQAVKA